MIQRFYILDWESIGHTFLENVSLSPQVHNSVHISIYYKSKEMPAKLLPQFRSLHVPRNATVCSLKDAQWLSVLRKLTWKNPRCQIPEPRDICFVSSQATQCFGDLMDLLTSNNVQYRVIKSEADASILNEFEYKCVKCRLVLGTRRAVKKHDEKFCGYFEECLTGSGKRKVGFSKTAREVRDADDCRICLSNCVLTYCPHRNRSEDMTSVHKTQFVGKTHPCWSNFDTNTYCAHFLYGYDLLPCLAVTGCQRSFPSLQEQAHHHVTEHGCRKPYFCMVCYKVLRTVCFENEDELLFHGKLEGHCEAEFAFI